MSSKSIPNKKETLPGVPKNFSEQAALTDDELEVAKRESSGTMKSGSGEDPFVESGLPENDPERPRKTPEEQSNR
jgi:hypothetical protein